MNLQLGTKRPLWRPRNWANVSALAREAPLPMRRRRQNWAVAAGAGILLGLSVLGLSLSPPKWLPFLLMAILFVCVVLITRAPSRLLLAAALMDIPLQLDISLAYRPELGRLGGLMGFSLSVTTISLACLYVIWLSRGLLRLQAAALPPFRVWAPAGLYLAFAWLSLLGARDVQAGLFEVVMLTQTFLLYIYIVANVRTAEDVKFAVSVLLLGLILESIIMILLGMNLVSFQIPGITTRVDAAYIGAAAQRVGGTVGSPISGASYLSMLLAPALGVLLAHWSNCYDRLAAAAFGLGVLALVLPFSRGAWLAAAISCTLLCVWALRRGWLSLKVPVLALGLTSFIAVLFYQPIVDRLLMSDSGSIDARAPLTQVALRVIADKPLLGVGANNYGIVIEQYVPGELWGRFLYTVHNKYLLTWAETGVGGFLSFIGFLLLTLRRGWQSWKFGDRTLSPVALGLALAIAGQMVHMSMDVFHARSQVQLLWVIAALIAACYLIGRGGASCGAAKP